MTANDSHSFALYRLPDHEEIILVEQDKDTPACPLAPPLEGLSGFALAPFRQDDAHPALIIRADKVREWKQEGISCDEMGKNRPNLRGNKEAYKETFAPLHRVLREGRMQKLVLSHTFECEGVASMKVFQRMLDQYPHSLVYMAHTPQTGLWIGASPEVLVRKNGAWWETMALAGTKRQSIEDWDAKNRHEQALVADYIAEKLAPLSEEVKQEGPTTLQTGLLYHLCTHFAFRCRDGVRLHQVIDALHPTPAVCGLPKEEAMQLILDCERHDRSYYAGYVGPINIEGETYLNVNIRCGKVDGNKITCFAGSGLLESSSLESEWDEISHKAAAII